MKFVQVVRGVVDFYCMITATLILIGVQAAPAQTPWTVSNVEAIWSGFNNHFYYTDSSGRGYYYRQEPSVTDSGNPGGFWQSAERIEMAVDAYYWDLTNDPSNAATDKTRFLNLANGFRNSYGDEVSNPSTGTVTNNGWGNWTPMDDDLMWAGLAFMRAYSASGSSILLTDAEGAFDEVYARGYDTNYGGGVWWDSRYRVPGGGSSDNKAAVSNFPFAILGQLIYAASGIGRYNTEATSVYNWAASKLVNASTGQVANDWEGSGSGSGNWGFVTYNYGVAIGAAWKYGNGTLASQMGSYIISNVASFSGGATVNGYGVLPNYGQAGNGYGLFNGIMFRWMGFAYNAGMMPSNWLAWAQTNIELGWQDRNATAQSWDDWVPDPPAGSEPWTPSSALYSNDCTPIVVGMFYVPHP